MKNKTAEKKLMKKVYGQESDNYNGEALLQKHFDSLTKSEIQSYVYVRTCPNLLDYEQLKKIPTRKGKSTESEADNPRPSLVRIAYMKRLSQSIAADPGLAPRLERQALKVPGPLTNSYRENTF